MKNRNNRTNKFVQKMNEQYKDCPVHVNTYDVMYRYAEDRAMSKMLGTVPRSA